MPRCAVTSSTSPSTARPRKAFVSPPAMRSGASRASASRACAWSCAVRTECIKKYRRLRIHASRRRSQASQIRREQVRTGAARRPRVFRQAEEGLSENPSPDREAQGTRRASLRAAVLLITFLWPRKEKKLALRCEGSSQNNVHAHLRLQS